MQSVFSPTTASAPPLSASELPSPPNSRDRSLDALRGLAVVLMLGQHLIVWLTRPLTGDEALALVITQTISGLGGLAAPLFLVLAGLGGSWRKGLGSGKPLRSDRSNFLRATLLLALAYLLSFAAPNWFSWRSWYILHLLAAAMVVATWLDRRPRSWLLALIALWTIGTPLVQGWLALPSSLSNPDMAGLHAGQAPIGWLANLQRAGKVAVAAGHFPIFPWLLAYFYGRLAGSWWGQAKKVCVLGLAIASTGGLALLIGVVADLAPKSYFGRWCAPNAPFFPASVAMVMALSGLALLALGLGQRYAHVFNRRGWDWLVALGRISLTILLVHIVVFREWSRPLGLWHAMEPAWVILAIVLIVASFAALARQWSRVNYRGSVEWGLRRLSAAPRP